MARQKFDETRQKFDETRQQFEVTRQKSEGARQKSVGPRQNMYGPQKAKVTFSQSDSYGLPIGSPGSRRGHFGATSQTAM